MQLGNANLGDEGDEGKEPSSLEPRVGARWWVSRGATGRANLGDGGDEGKEPPSLRPRAVGDDTGGGAEVLAQILKSGKMAKKSTDS
jgi:hypothetical protein